MRNVSYENVSATPSTLARTVRVVVSDGDGGSSVGRGRSGVDRWGKIRGRDDVNGVRGPGFLVRQGSQIAPDEFRRVPQPGVSPMPDLLGVGRHLQLLSERSPTPGAIAEQRQTSPVRTRGLHEAKDAPQKIKSFGRSRRRYLDFLLLIGAFGHAFVSHALSLVLVGRGVGAYRPTGGAPGGIASAARSPS